MAKLIITRGLPGSGKTTWAKGLQPLGAVRANRDDLRRSMYGRAKCTHEEECVVSSVQLVMVRDNLKRGKTVIVDDTNLKQSVARKWANLAKSMGVEFEVVDFTDVTVDECVSRDRWRSLNENVPEVGEAVIRDMHARYLAAGPLAQVVAAEAVEHKQYTGTPGKPDAWIVDIDGTLALNNGHRSPYDYSKVHLDKPHQAVVDLVDMISWSADTDTRGWPKLLIVSGRTDDCRLVTWDWLNSNLAGDITDLLMRRPGDHRKDAIVKEEIFWRDIAPNYNVIGVLDDRQQVVDMWRDLGLTCLQVAPGDF